MEENKSVIWIDIPNDDHLSITLKFNQSKPHSVWMDWGDGSQRETYDVEGLVEATHTYEKADTYEISFFAVDEAYIELIGITNEEGFRNMITDVTIGDDVTSILPNAFANCENMETLQFLGKYVDIGEYAFSNCSALEGVALPEENTIVQDGVFFNCSGLKKVQLPEHLGVVGNNAFYGCSHLKSINLSNLIKVGDYAFHGCRKLTDVVFSIHITDIGASAFDSCTNIKTLDLSTTETIGEHAFANCKSVSRVTIPETVKTIGEGAFEYCTFVKLIKMAAHEPPILQGVDAFNGIDNFTLEVPRGSKRTYGYATNWSVYLNRMEESL